MIQRALLLSCLFVTACAPSINPQMQQATDAMVASMKASYDVAAPASYDPMPWAVGQWVVLRVTDSKQQPSVMRLSVVGKEGEALWIETETQDYYRHSISKMLFSKMPRTADEAADALLKMVTKEDGQEPVTMDFTANDPAAKFAKKLMKSAALNLAIPNVSNPRVEDARVAAGTFQGCARLDVKVTMGPVTKDTTSWFHPAVPINGTVRGTSADGEWTIELLDFGSSGAQSRL